MNKVTKFEVKEMNYEALEKPQLAPINITAEEANALPVMDKLMQFILPKFVNKVLTQEYEIELLKRKLEVVQVQSQARDCWLNELDNWAGEVTENINKLGASKPRVSRKKKDKDEAAPAPAKSEPVEQRPCGVVSVAISTVADYDPDIDEWVPKKFGGKLGTYKELFALNTLPNEAVAAENGYNADYLKWARELTPDQCEYIRQNFSG